MAGAVASRCGVTSRDSGTDRRSSSFANHSVVSSGAPPSPDRDTTSRALTLPVRRNAVADRERQGGRRMRIQENPSDRLRHANRNPANQRTPDPPEPNTPQPDQLTRPRSRDRKPGPETAAEPTRPTERQRPPTRSGGPRKPARPATNERLNQPATCTRPGASSGPRPGRSSGRGEREFRWRPGESSGLDRAEAQDPAGRELRMMPLPSGSSRLM